MDPNLVQWKIHGQSFLQRLRLWMNLLDPSLLLASDAEILKAHALLGSRAKPADKDDAALSLSLSSFHADSGAALPLAFRPPAFLPMSGLLVLGTLLPHGGVKPALFWQFLLQSYNAGFSYANRNASAEQGKAVFSGQLALMVGTVSCTTFAGALPQIFINRLGITSGKLQTFFRYMVPMPLSAALAFFCVFTVRSQEKETGIQVYDYTGKPVGVSKAAGEKAVRETALSRAALLGATAAVPNFLILLLPRRVFRGLVAPLRSVSATLVLGLMIPVSFSLFPPLGTVEKGSVEAELQARAVGSRLFYHRGL
ncbi:sideroflexin-4 isoform 2-T2 [Menidia menidia]